MQLFLDKTANLSHATFLRIKIYIILYFVDKIVNPHCAIVYGQNCKSCLFLSTKL